MFRLPGGGSYVVERDANGKAFESAECPRSAASPQMLELVQFIGEQLTMAELTGCAMFPGPNMATWPAWYHDAVAEVAARRRMRQNAEQQAMASER